MRIALVVHGLPPYERTGVENHVAALARALSRQGLEVLVFAPRTDPRAPEFAQRREAREHYTVTWLVTNQGATSAEEHLERPGAAAAFGEFLDRERPRLVHFHHLLKLGIGLIAEARRRGLPTLYTAHDYYPICHRAVLARPDLARCVTLGDSHACAKCDSAVAWLDAKARWSDYQAGVLPRDLSGEESDELAELLEYASEPAGFDALRERRARLDRRRNEAFAQLDLVLAPTDFLRDQLIAGGLDPAKIERSDYGLEVERLATLPPPRDGADHPLAFGFLGGAHKHKGLHVLLDAYALLRVPARLHVHADSSDREYVQAMRLRARDVGAEWRPAFTATELPGILESVDVVVVPSIWWENAPFVIREAQAARRPVITSDLPALRESVRDEVDGLVVAPGDARALADAMERLAADSELVKRLSRNAPAPRTLELLAAELFQRYRALAASAQPEVAAHVPASVRPFARRVLELESATLEELAARAQHGLAALARSLRSDEGALGPVDAEAMALERLADARREIAWRVEREADSLSALELDRARDQAALERAGADCARAVRDGEEARAALAAARQALEARNAQFEELERTHGAARNALEAEQRAHAKARSALASASEAFEGASRERDALAGVRAELLRTRAELEARVLELATEKLDWKKREATAREALVLARARAEEAEGDARALGQSLHSNEARLREFELDLAEATARAHALVTRHAELTELHAELEREHSELAHRFEALERHARWLEVEAGALACRLGHPAQALRNAADFDLARAALESLERELDWRRKEMSALRTEGGRVVRALVLRSAFGRRLRGWELGA